MKKNKKSGGFYLWTFLLILLLPVNSGIAATKTKTVPLKSIDVTSDSFDMILKDSMMTFNKNVRIKAVNFASQCDKALVYLEAKTGKVKKIIMSGHVKLQKDNSQINGEKVTFELENERLTVEGNVKTKIKFSE